MSADHYAPAWLTKWLAAPDDDDDDGPWYGPPQVVLHVPGRGTVYLWNFTRFEAEAMTGEAVTDGAAGDSVQRWLCSPADPSMVELWTNELAIARETVAGWPLFPANQLDLFA